MQTNYKGWPNYATWNVDLWLRNDPMIRRQCLEAIDAHKTNAQRDRALARIALVTVRDAVDFGQVNWSEIRKGFTR